VNLLTPAIIINNPGQHADVINSVNPLPARFRPSSTVRGAASTIISFSATCAASGVLGEYNISPAGIITLGLPGNALGPQLISSNGGVQADIDTITYNLNGCGGTCNNKKPCS
jgi:hypothetical protein